MPSISEVEQFMDFLAQACQLVRSFPLAYNQLHALVGYDEIYTQTDSELESNWKSNDLQGFFAFLQDKVTSITNSIDQSRYVEAQTICEWMDSKISYIPTAKEGMFSIAAAVHISKNQVVQVGTLNPNYKQAGIQIYPKFSVADAYEIDDTGERARSLASRDSMFGLNSDLDNVLVVPLQQGLSVCNIIFPYENIIDAEDNCIKIAFLPLTADEDILLYKKTTVTWDGITMQGVEPYGLRDPEPTVALNRFSESWKESCRQGADIVFAPEMLGTYMTESTELEGAYNALVKNLSLEMLLVEHKRSPSITIMPSYWHDGVNCVTIVDSEGAILGHQNKNTPFINKRLHEMEALKQPSETCFLIIHIPGVHRIVVMVCAEFLASYDRSSKEKICAEFGATLFIVPSYTHGEQDFINTLPSLKCYGATVIWGNSCSAAKAPRVIGGCSIAGTDVISRFSDACQCNFICNEKVLACGFLITLPVHLIRVKPIPPTVPSIQHFLC